jgi:hypothetical protein
MTVVIAIPNALFLPLIYMGQLIYGQGLKEVFDAMLASVRRRCSVASARISPSPLSLASWVLVSRLLSAEWGTVAACFWLHNYKGRAP